MWLWLAVGQRASRGQPQDKIPDFAAPPSINSQNAGQTWAELHLPYINLYSSVCKPINSAYYTLAIRPCLSLGPCWNVRSHKPVSKFHMRVWSPAVAVASVPFELKCAASRLLIDRWRGQISHVHD
eukprot:COSAG01_NODE_3803_length_5680_cov_19.836230_4_plen_126_part_00